MGRSLTFAFACSLVVLATGCGKNAPMLVSQDQEIQIGQQVAAEAEQEYGRPLASGPYVDRLNRVARPLLARAQRNVPYRIQVLPRRDVVNAFACPGGPVYVTTGLMDVERQDAELAFVVGHEIGHVENQHGRLAINDAMLASTAASVLLRDQGQLVQFGASIVYTLWNRGYSRQYELESDTTGLRLMSAVGYDPQYALSALQNLGGGSQSGVTRWLATHPSTPERVARLRDQIARDYGGGRSIAGAGR